MVYQLYFRCFCTQTVPPCGGSICYSPRATSATSPCQRLTLPMGSVWARSVPCVMAACFLTRPCQGLRRICWVTEIFFSLYSSSFSTLSGPISGTITLLSFSVNPVLITCLCTHITFSFVRIQYVSVCILTVYWKFFFFSCLSRYLHTAVSFPASGWSLREGDFSVSGHDRLYFLQTWQRTGTVHQAAGKHTHTYTHSKALKLHRHWI